MGNDMGKINILVEGWLHFKNETGISLMNSDKIQFHNNIDLNIIVSLDYKNY